MSDKKKYVYVLLDENTHSALAREASRVGKHICDFAEDCIIESLRVKVPHDDPKQKLWLQTQDSRERARTFNSLKNLVWEALNSSDEQRLDSLQEMCISNGFLFSDILESIQESTIKPVMYDDPLGVKAAMVWLSGIVVSGCEYKPNDIIALGVEQGFSESVINAAKKSLGIKSTRRSNGWSWSR